MAPTRTRHVDVNVDGHNCRIRHEDVAEVGVLHIIKSIRVILPTIGNIIEEITLAYDP
eukprot:CAMPEP_0172771588 /NCGR_PEP_ID=MMETSP1074-20121228/190836_1 /TAXON_ID=2916 /ORGANISM="Ceratium fusus, Strain PA161109" /LENGTH=57 /DNA_ID=CAMNT_0013607533 /DNA_START=91 /DNA_END=261 /DNA_ORIENTATION=+